MQTKVKLTKGIYITIVSYGEGRHFIRGPLEEGLIQACRNAKAASVLANKVKAKRAPIARITVARIVEVYDGSSSVG